MARLFQQPARSASPMVGHGSSNPSAGGTRPDTFSIRNHQRRPPTPRRAEETLRDDPPHPVERKKRSGTTPTPSRWEKRCRDDPERQPRYEKRIRKGAEVTP